MQSHDDRDGDYHDKSNKDQLAVEVTASIAKTNLTLTSIPYNQLKFTPNNLVTH